MLLFECKLFFYAELNISSTLNSNEYEWFSISIFVFIIINFVYEQVAII